MTLSVPEPDAPTVEMDLLSTVQVQKQELKRKDAEIHALKEALRLMAIQKNGESNSEEETDDPDAQTTTLAGDTESDDELPDPVFDGDLLYCSECAFELEVDVDGGACVCGNCGREHDWETYKDVFVPDSCLVDNQAASLDRDFAPRGDTPTRDLEDVLADEVLPFELPLEYRPRACRMNEYLELRRRGATQLMCEEFHLEFTLEEGIYAWADSVLFEEFADPDVMQEGDFWKIHLGRRVVLEKDDHDGSKFIEGILEDALLFPLFGPNGKDNSGKWETMEEEPGIWVTRLKTKQRALDGDDAATLSDDEEDVPEETVDQPADSGDPTDDLDEAPVLGHMQLKNEYELSDDELEDEDEDENVSQHDDGASESGNVYYYESSEVSEHPCECPQPNMCLACMTEPDGNWSDGLYDGQEHVDEQGDADELHEDEDEDDRTSEISTQSEASSRSTEF